MKIVLFYRMKNYFIFLSHLVKVPVTSREAGSVLLTNITGQVEVVLSFGMVPGMKTGTQQVVVGARLQNRN